MKPTPGQIRRACAIAAPHVARIDGAGVPVWLNDSRKEFDPLEDLNACAEMEKVLTLEQWAEYGRLLSGPMSLTPQLYRNAINATAERKCDFFLRVVRPDLYAPRTNGGGEK